MLERFFGVVAVSEKARLERRPGARRTTRRNVERTSAGKQKLERCRQELLGRISVCKNMGRMSVGGNLARTSVVGFELAN